MSWNREDWKKLVRTVAPGLATALGGPLAGAAVQTISTAVLGKPDGTEEEVALAVASGGTDGLLKLKEAENAFTIKMKELGVDLEKVHAGDRADARNREVKTGDVWTPRVLAATIVGGFLTMVYMVLSGYVEGLKDPLVAGMVGTLIGYVSAKADQVVSYYFGSSAGSAAKTDLLARNGK
jgi:hypothetical protein